MDMKVFKYWGAVVVLALAWGQAGSAAGQPAPAEKVLRYAFRAAETGFDPIKVSDVYSHTIIENIIEGLYTYDYLARPVKVVPLIADGMPVVTDDFKTYTIKLKHGIYFADDPAFCGADGQHCKKREVTAQDFVYSIKRIYDPKNLSPVASDFEDLKILGMNELRAKAEKSGKPFDYDSQVEGMRALDRYTIQFKLAETRPRFLYKLAAPGVVGAVAREVIEKYADKTMEHPVGTGPFMLSRWVRSSSITLVKNPNFRESHFDAEPAADDAQAQAIYRQMKGKRIPMVDKVVVSIIDEDQPRWLAFLGNEHDLYYELSATYAYQAIPNNQLAPNLAKRGIQMARAISPDLVIHYFNMEDATVGGYTPDKVALRRAIALAYNAEEEIRLSRRNQAIAAQGVIAPMTYGYDPAFKTEMSEYSPARAMALLDMYGYVDKNGDGWRDMPDGSPLVLEYGIGPDATAREQAEIWRKSMAAIGIKIVFKVAKWPEHLKAARAGKLMMWGLGNSASEPDGGDSLGIAYGPAKGEGNLARFDLPEYNKLVVQQQFMPDGPERLEVLQRASKLLVAYMPYKASAHRIRTDLWHPWLSGFMRHPMTYAFWKYVDIDMSKMPQH